MTALLRNKRARKDGRGQAGNSSLHELTIPIAALPAAVFECAESRLPATGASVAETEEAVGKAGRASATPFATTTKIADLILLPWMTSEAHARLPSQID